MWCEQGRERPETGYRPMNVACPLPNQPNVRRLQFESLIVGLLLIFGLYWPSSMGENSSKLLLGLGYSLCSVLFLFLMSSAGGQASLPACISLIAVLPLLLLFTFTSGLQIISFGELAAFAALASLYMLNLKRIQFPQWLSHLYVALSISSIALGIAILAGSELAKEVLAGHYSQFYPELVPAMLLLRKPVLTFGTHSLAGFFLYLFFYVSLQTYKVKGNKLFLILALCYLSLTLALLSVTGLILGLIGVVQLLYSLWSLIGYRWFWASAVAVMILVLSFQLPRFLASTWTDMTEGAKSIVTSPVNGLLGRLTAAGTMSESMQYLEQHPFSPLGISGTEELLAPDMGLVHYLLRGSVILVIWVYGGLFFFLKRSLLARSDLYFLFVAILAFELGFSSLLYFRTPYLIAFVVVYLNGLRRGETETAGGGHMLHARGRLRNPASGGHNLPGQVVPRY
jgi:hypothetical protein